MTRRPRKQQPEHRGYELPGLQETGYDCMLVDIFFCCSVRNGAGMVRAALGVVSVLRSQRTHSPAQGRLRALAALDGLTGPAEVVRVTTQAARDVRAAR